MATDFEDPRVTLRFQDASKYVAECDAAAFDVVIVDSSDPNDGPASVLFTADFYRNLARVLKPGGIVCTQVRAKPRAAAAAARHTMNAAAASHFLCPAPPRCARLCAQGECQWLSLPLIKDVLTKAKDFFPSVDYAYTCTPTYPCGQIGFLLCYKSSDPEYVRSARRAVPDDVAKRLRYYSPAMHKASFLLPRFAEEELAALRPRGRTGHSAWDYAAYTAILVGAGLLGGAVASWLGAKPAAVADAARRR